MCRYGVQPWPHAGPLVVVLAGAVIAAVPLLFGDILAVFGADGAPAVGLGIGGALVLVGGLLLGVVGGSLCVAWKPATE